MLKCSVTAIIHLGMHLTVACFTSYKIVGISYLGLKDYLWSIQKKIGADTGSDFVKNGISPPIPGGRGGEKNKKLDCVCGCFFRLGIEPRFF